MNVAGMTRTITDHVDGHGLNDSISIRADEEDGSGASHHYAAIIGADTVAAVQFQQGPRLDASSTRGVTEAVLMAILIDRMRGFQSGPYACRENAIILTKLEECLMWTRHRADERAARGVLGRNAK